jgi:hypothetical protein
MTSHRSLAARLARRRRVHATRARDRVAFRELGADWLARRYSPEHRARRLVRQLEALGLKVTLEAAS